MKAPKYVQKILNRRYKLAMDLMVVDNKLSDYLEKLGILNDVDIYDAVMSGCLIYLEPEVARRIVLEKIEETLKECKNNA